MSHIIEIEKLSKLYQIGRHHESYKTLRDTVGSIIKNYYAIVRHGRKSNSIDQYFWALKDINFNVDQGEVIGIIGPNGAGKSTLLKILSHITNPTEGRVTLRGRVGCLLEVGTGFHPELTGRENIFLNGAILGMHKKEIEQKFDEIVAFSEIEKFIDTPVKKYSSGMYVRLAFAVAAHLEPEILIVDEVLAVGDVNFQKKCLGKMENISQGGRTVIFVSHNLGAVRKLCRRSILLNDGKLVGIGDTEEICNQYLLANTLDYSAKIELPPGNPDLPGKGVKISFHETTGELKTTFRLGEHWKIRLEFDMMRSMPHIIAAVGINSIDGVPIVTYWSKPRDISIGKYFVEFECAIPFSSMGLQFSVGISSNVRTFYYVENIGFVSISEIAIDEQPIRSSGTGLLFSSQDCEIEDLR